MMMTRGPIAGAWYCQSCHASIAVYGVVSVSCPYCSKQMTAARRVRIVELEPIVMHRWSPFDLGETAMIALIKKYAKAIVAGIGYAASIATALGLQHQHYIAVVLGVLSTIAVILTKNSTPNVAGSRPARGI